MPQLKLVSHTLCPYVQRAAIALSEKKVPFERVYVDLSNKPDWFSAISPLGRVPLLQVGTSESPAILFESAVILEYLEETQPRPLHPTDPLQRAHHRGWIEFGSNLLNGIARLYNAKTSDVFYREQTALRAAFERLEADLTARDVKQSFTGSQFSLVDAVYGPVFRYFDVFDTRTPIRVLNGLTRIASWRKALDARPSVKQAVGEDYPELLTEFLHNRQSHISTLIVCSLDDAAHGNAHGASTQ